MTAEVTGTVRTQASPQVGRWRSDQKWMWLVATWLVCAVYMYLYLMRGWVPHDEGSLALSAERVLRGEVPHRDFDELYTGGLTYWHALAFRFLGIKLTSLRWALFIGYLAWVPAVYAVARRFTDSPGAAGLTVLAAAWSVPNYAASMPSWYNLFFLTLGSWASMRFLESRRKYWLFLAGLCGGASICVKISGLYFVAALWFFLVYYQQDETTPAESESGTRLTAFAVLVCLSSVIFVFALFSVIRPLLSVTFFAHFLVPSAVVAAAVVWRELSRVRAATVLRSKKLLEVLFPCLVGMSIPCSALLILYAAKHSLRSFLTGVILLPQSRLRFASTEHTEANLAGIVILCVLSIALLWALFGHRTPQLLSPLLGLGLFLAVIASGSIVSLYCGLWFAASSLVPLVVLFGCGRLEHLRCRGLVPSAVAQKAFLLLGVTAICSLIQFPFAAPVYFLYVAPLLWLAVEAAIRARPKPPSHLNFALGIPALLFVVLRVTPGFIFSMGYHYAPDRQTHELRLERAAGLRVSPDEGRTYELLVAAVQARSQGGNIYAGPDSPEIYFLAGKPNSMRTLFDFVDDPNRQEAEIRRVLEDESTRVAVIRSAPQFSEPLSPALQDLVWQRYPQFEEFGPFELHWR